MPVALAPFAVLAQAQPTTAEVAACGPGEEASAACMAIFRWTGNEVVAKLSDAIVVRPAKIAVIVAVALVVTRVLRRAIAKLVAGLHADRDAGEPGPIGFARRAQRAQTIGALLRSIATLAVWTIAALMAMSELGLNLGPLIAGAGIVGIALGFGAQNLVRDFVSGIFMLVEDQYGVGDVIDVGPATGVVEGVSLRTTRVRDIEGTLWHVPNGQINRVGNKSQQWARALLDVSVAYATELEGACEIIKQAADDLSQDPELGMWVLEAPEVWGVENLGADGIAIRMAVKTVPNKQWKVARALRARVKAALDEAGIEIPFPQRTVWHRVGEGGGAFAPVGVDGGAEDRRG